MALRYSNHRVLLDLVLLTNWRPLKAPRPLRPLTEIINEVGSYRPRDPMGPLFFPYASYNYCTQVMRLPRAHAFREDKGVPSSTKQGRNTKVFSSPLPPGLHDH